MNALNAKTNTFEKSTIINSKNTKLYYICQKIVQNGNKNKLFHVVEKPPVDLKGVATTMKWKLTC